MDEADDQDKGEPEERGTSIPEHLLVELSQWRGERISDPSKKFFLELAIFNKRRSGTGGKKK